VPQTPNPQSPIPNPQSPINNDFKLKFHLIMKFLIFFLKFLKIKI